MSASCRRACTPKGRASVILRIGLSTAPYMFWVVRPLRRRRAPEKMGELAHAHHVGKVKGRHSKGHKGRAARASGGKTGSNRRRPPPRSPWPAGGAKERPAVESSNRATTRCRGAWRHSWLLIVLPKLTARRTARSHATSRRAAHRACRRQDSLGRRSASRRPSGPACQAPLPRRRS